MIKADGINTPWNFPIPLAIYRHKKIIKMVALEIKGKKMDSNSTTVSFGCCLYHFKKMQ